MIISQPEPHSSTGARSHGAGEEDEERGQREHMSAAMMPCLALTAQLGDSFPLFFFFFSSRKTRPKAAHLERLQF
jgi:hypothetical protein